MWPIIKKEVKSYFLSPVAYVFIGLFLAMREYIFLLRCVHVFKYKFWIYVLFSFNNINIYCSNINNENVFRGEKKWNRAAVIYFSKKYNINCSGKIYFSCNSCNNMWIIYINVFWNFIIFWKTTLRYCGCNINRIFTTCYGIYSFWHVCIKYNWKSNYSSSNYNGWIYFYVVHAKFL